MDQLFIGVKTLTEPHNGLTVPNQYSLIETLQQYDIRPWKGRQSYNENPMAIEVVVIV